MNNKLSPKTIKIISVITAMIFISILAYTIVGLVKSINKNKQIQTVSQAEYNEDSRVENIDEINEIVDIEDLANTIKEEKEENNSDSNSSKSNNGNSNKNNTSKYYIKVNCSANVVTIYTKDTEGNYTVPYKAMICSTGTATPRYLGGKYAVKSRWEWGALFGGVYGHYCVHIVDQILFHSVPYLKNSPDSLEYWEYDKLRNISFSRVYKIDC